MDSKAKDKYEEIRSIASRDWLKPASVSLAKFDEVKANVYNLGLADPKQLKATSGNLTVKQIDSINTQPPLSSLVQQRHVWGSNNSIPDLLKQSERKKFSRPWSAQNRTSQAKVVLKKPRPHSAKDTLFKPPRPGSAKQSKKTSITVKGAHYEAEERPVGGVGTCHTVSGWAAPAGGIHAEHAIEMVTQEQNFTEGNKTPVDIPPPSPRGSPDFNHFLDTDENSQRINSAVGNLVDELLEDTRKPSPREPIHLTLPSAEVYEDANEDRVDFDDDMEADIDRWIEDKKKYNEQELNIDEILNGFEEKLEIGSIPSKLLRTDIGGSAEELCEDFTSSDSEEENQDDKKTTGRNRKKDVHVTFDEEKNKTRTITPREEDSYVRVTSIQSSKRNVEISTGKPDSAANHYRATPDLRNISSKINSNPQPHTAGRRIERRHKKQTSDTNSIENCHSAGRQSPNKQHVPLSTISVTYLEDEDQINDSQTLRRSKSRGHSEIETVISQLSSSDSESEEESRPGSRTKAVSQYSNRNYYQLSADEDRPKVLTRKTLELGDGTVIERKTVFLLDNHKQPHKSYVVPMENRPKSASTVNRPKSATKPKPQKAEKGSKFLCIMEQQSITQEPQSVPVIQETPKYSSVQIKRPKSGKKSDTNSHCESEKKDTSAVDSTESTEGIKSKKEVTFADAPEVRTVGAHNCKCVTVSADRTQRPHSAPCKSVYRRPGSGRSTQRTEDNVKYPKPFSLLKQRIDEERRKQMLDNVPQITTKYREYVSVNSFIKDGTYLVTVRNSSCGKEVEDSEGVKECKDMQGYLIDAGVPVNLDTLYRALLPPTQYPAPPVSLVTNTVKPFPRHTVGLVSKPCYWLPEEYKRLVQAKKLVRQANLSLWYQEREEEREALKAAGITVVAKKKKKKKRRTGKKIAADHSRTQSAPSGEQIRLKAKRIRSAPPGARKKPEDTADHISLQDLM